MIGFIDTLGLGGLAELADELSAGVARLSGTTQTDVEPVELVELFGPDAVVIGGERPIAVVKAIRELTGAGLKEAKEILDDLLFVVVRLERPDAEALLVNLRAAGAIVELT